jgi:hypothetical protein
VAARVDLPAAVVDTLADRCGRDRAEFRSAWRGKTPAEADRFWDAVDPAGGPDPVLRTLARLAAEGEPPGAAADLLLPDTAPGSPYPALETVAGLIPDRDRPAVLFAAGPRDDPLTGPAAAAVEWATHLPAVPVALAVPAPAWDAYLREPPETRAKAHLREGVVPVPVHDAAAVARELAAAGFGGGADAAAGVIAAGGATDDLVRAAADAVRAVAPPPADPADDDRARSAAERFLFEFLESIPETAGRFELNGRLDFRFGPRPAEVDLLARADRVAVEVDGYFHFRGPDDYRRDRDKDWELQQRGFVVLRFLAEDVVRRIEQVRDRILAALTPSRSGRSL